MNQTIYSPQNQSLQEHDRQYWDAAIETLPRDELEKLQFTRLKQHLIFAYENSPYYRDAFIQAGVNPADLQTLADLRHYPFVDKKVERTRQLAKPLLGDMLAVPERDVVYVSASSGSTGVPTLSPFTAADFDNYQNIQARLFWAAGMRPDDRYVHALNFTLFVGGPDVIGAHSPPPVYSVYQRCVLPTDRRWLFPLSGLNDVAHQCSLTRALMKKRSMIAVQCEQQMPPLLWTEHSCH